jgi:hypothetical protein
MRIPLGLLASFALVSAFAQPVLDQSSTPQAGVVYTYVSAERQDLPGLGAGQVWDAAEVQPISQSTIQFIDLANAQGAADFPQADVVMFSLGKETYLESTTDGLYAVGTYIASPTITVVYSDSFRLLRFPCTLGTAWTDTYAGPYLYNGEAYVRSGSGTFEATGYGTLVLPGGAVHDVLRIDGRESYTEAGGNNLFTYTDSFSLFYKPGLGSYVARNDSIATTFNGASSPVQLRFLHMDSTSLGTDPVLGRWIGMEVFPNPASDLVHVVFAADDALNLAVFDAHGRQVATARPPVHGVGVHRYPLALDGYAPGLYTVIAVSRDGRHGLVRFTVVR